MARIENYEDPKDLFMRQIESMRPDLYFPESWGQADRQKATELVRSDKVKTNMFSAIPMTCKAEKCIYANTCPLLAQGLAPKGNLCPIEMAIVQQFFQEYVEELNIDVTRLVEVSMIRDLVDQEVQYMRKTKILAEEHFIQENPIGIDPQGRPIIHKELHQAVEMEDKIHKRKDKLRSQLLATREARAKAGQASLDTAQALANLLEDVDKINALRENNLRRQLGRDALYDDYIEASGTEELDPPKE